LYSSKNTGTDDVDDNSRISTKRVPATENGLFFSCPNPTSRPTCSSVLVLPEPWLLAAALRRVPPERRSGPVLRPWANACTDLRAACKRASIERVTPHTFRHTFGSWLVQAGVDTFVVGKLMGHRDSKMVERYYGHLAPKNKSEAMARLPRFPALFPSETPAESPPGPCDAGVPNLVAIPGAYGAPGATPAPAPKRTKAAISEEKWPLSASLGSEGSRTRTYNQRIKSPMLYH